MQVDQPAASFDRALKRMKETGEEFCISCLEGVGFSAQAHVESPVRSKNGARYVEGAGQLCTKCGPVLSTMGVHAEH